MPHDAHSNRVQAMTSQTKANILFVDDEQQVLNALRRSLHHYRNEWQMQFVNSGQQALELMEQQRFDVIITDMTMSKMNGSSLLSEVRDRYPNTIRIMLSGDANTEAILNNTQSIHIFLSKPTPTKLLTSTIQRAITLQAYLSEPKLVNLVSGIGVLPSLPDLYNKITEEMRAENSSLTMVGNLIAQDIGITTKILQLVNSPFFGLQQEINSAAHATSYLGITIVRNLVLASELFENFKHAGIDVTIIERLWKHAHAVSNLAVAIARLEGMSEAECNIAFTAGLLHDIGKLVLQLHCPEHYQKVEQLMAEGVSNIAAEQQVFGAHHGAVGAYLISLWGLPTLLAESISFHHDLQWLDNNSMTAAMAVYIANSIIKEQEGTPATFDNFFLEPGLSADKVALWRQLADSTTKGDPSL
jgi:putative nucleotidyltransferase with HDIG domain